MTTDIEVYDAEVFEKAPATLIPAETPKEFMAQAAKVAAALVDLVDKEKMFTKVGQGKHLHVDAWTSLGSLLGSVGGKSVYAVPDGEPEPIEIDGVKGVKAKMKAVTIDGQVVGGATGFCMRDEPTWKNRPFYALAGMAETRATSRALRKPLGFIVRLAGYAATGAEEMPRDPDPPVEPTVDPDGNVAPWEQPGSPGQFAPPLTHGEDQAPPPMADMPNRGTVTEAQLRMIRRLVKKLEGMGQAEDVLRDSLELQWQTRHFSELSKDAASKVITALKGMAGEETT